jgi:hypothetical protein
MVDFQSTKMNDHHLILRKKMANIFLDTHQNVSFLMFHSLYGLQCLD